MDQEVPLQGIPLLSLGLLTNTFFATYPAVSGVIESGGTLTVNVPGSLIVGLINSLNVYAAHEDGSHPVLVGSVSSLLGLSGNVPIPITTPLKLRNKVLILNIQSILGVDLNLGSTLTPATVTLSGLDGKPSNPQ